MYKIGQGKKCKIFLLDMREEQSYALKIIKLLYITTSCMLKQILHLGMPQE